VLLFQQFMAILEDTYFEASNELSNSNQKFHFKLKYYEVTDSIL